MCRLERKIQFGRHSVCRGLIESLKDHIELECDAPQASLHIYQQAKSNMFEFLKEASHVKRLANLNIFEDIKFCLTIDKYDVVPIFVEG